MKKIENFNLKKILLILSITMTKSYICEFCKKEFSQKNDLQRHLTKKNGCIPINQIMEKKEQQTTMNGKIQELHSLFKTCLDVLRNDAEHLIGDEALNELSHFLILKQAEKHIENGSIDIYNLELYKDGVKKYGNEKFLEYLEYVKFSKLIEYVKIPEKESNIKKIFDEFLWKEVLSKHPKFKDVFEDGKKSFIKESTTIKKIVITLSSIDFNNYDYDILGEAYESIFVDAVFGAGGNKKSELGQFFTPPKVKKLLVNLVNPKLKENGEIESVMDPASGTGGILNNVIKYFKQFEKSNQITSEELRQQLIKNIYGIEIKGKIYNLCLSNMLINTGEILPNVICSDSIRKFHNIKVDNIVANPPFSVTIDYDELLTSLGSLEILDDYIPIKTGGKNSEVLFLQMMIHCLNINGRCASVMLDGQKMYGSTSGYDKAREYLMKSCDLHEVILCPAGTFTSTASKTCILFFTKKKERKDVVEITGTKRILKFCKSHSTKKVKFYDFNPDTEEKHFIKEVDINEIASKKYSLNYTEYGIDEEEIKDEEGIEWMELEKVYDKISTGSSINKNEIKEGIYPYYGANGIVNYVDVYDYDGEYLLIGRAGSSGKINYVKGKFKPNDNVFVISAKNIRYIYYLLVLDKYFKNIIKDGVIPVINKTNISKIKVPIPSIEKQNKIVEFLDKLYDKKIIKVENTADYYEGNNIFRLLLDDKYDIFEKLVEWQEQSIELSKQIEFFKNRQSRYLYLCSCSYDNMIISLNELFDIVAGKFNSKDCKEVGNYPFYTSKANNPEGFIDEYCFDYEKYFILIKDGGAGEGKYGDSIGLGKIFKVSGKSGATSHQLALIPKKIQNFEYLYHYLKSIKNKIMDMARYTIGLGCIKKSDLEKIKIPIPSLERQKEIVEYCEFNGVLIKQLEKEIENNKKQAKEFLLNIIKSNNNFENNDESFETLSNSNIDDISNEEIPNNEPILNKKKISVKKKTIS
jgi:type I restriction-modification system DNA methylase subunit